MEVTGVQVRGHKARVPPCRHLELLAASNGVVALTEEVPQGVAVLGPRVQAHGELHEVLRAGELAEAEAEHGREVQRGGLHGVTRKNLGDRSPRTVKLPGVQVPPCRLEVLGLR